MYCYQQPEHLYDDCGGDVTYFIGFVSGGLSTTGNAEPMDIYYWKLKKAKFIALNMLLKIVVEIEQVYTSMFRLQTLTPPVPVTKENIVISLSNIGNPVDSESRNC